MNAVLTTDRLIIREASLGDATFILQLVNDKGWLTYIGDRNIKTIPAAENYIQKSLLSAYKKDGFGLFLVALKNTNTCIGMCGLVNRPTLDNIDIGFAFLNESCGKGYGYESAKATIDYALNTLNLEKVLGITLATNIPSQKLLKKIGLTLEKEYTNDEGEEMIMYGVERPKHSTKVKIF